MGISKSNNKLVWLLSVVALLAATFATGQSQAPPCFFIFGDSLSDSGNNNVLATAAKFNYLPYGLDFPAGPTGRATNGRTVPDFLSGFMGMPLIPPFANTVGSDVLKGVNYASSGAGILLETGRHLGDELSLDRQLTNHGVTITTITGRLGGSAATKTYLNKCLYYANIGSNDYLNNYFLPQFYASSRLYNLDQFADLLIANYSRQLRALHGTGAKKFAIVSLGFTQCGPAAIFLGNVCAQAIRAGSIFNEKLKVMVDQFNSEFSGDSSFVIVNATAIFTLNPDFLGLRVKTVSCCVIVPATGLCVANGVPCLNRNDYVFWDGFHPTQAVNTIIANSAFNSSNPAFTYPTNIARLISSSNTL
ncbi:hypothetical protein K1719_007932 [Acacia pycnantha]|nr:hypothetical protein K1719_007932 [Acacia pycnantha]